MSKRSALLIFLAALVFLMGCDIEGTVTRIGSGVQGVSVAVYGEAWLSDVTDATGAYAFNDIKPGTYLIKPVLSGYTFSPLSRRITSLDLINRTVTVNFTAVADIERILLIPAMVGSYHLQEINLFPPIAGQYSAVGLPPGLYISPVTGLITGTPTTEGLYEIAIYLDGGTYFSAYDCIMLVLPVLSDYQRRLLVSTALHPHDQAASATASFGTVTRCDTLPTFFFGADPSLDPAGDNYSTNLGILSDGSKTAGRKLIEKAIETSVPLFTGGKHQAAITNTLPGGLLTFGVYPIRNAGAQGGRTTSETRIIETRSHEDLFGDGRIIDGFIRLPEEYFNESPGRSDMELYETIIHELGHVFNGPHTVLSGPGCTHQRWRLHRQPMVQDVGHPLYPFDLEEVLIYEILYHTPIGADVDDLISAGLITREDTNPPPVITDVMGMRPGSSGSWFPDSSAPVRAGQRVVILGGHFEHQWLLYPEVGNPMWNPAEILVPTDSGYVTMAGESISWVGGRDQRLEIVLPANAVSGDLFVRSTHVSTGTVRTSDPYDLFVHTD